MIFKKSNRKYKRGFSLLELILVLGVGSALAFMKFQDMIHDQEVLKASAAGQQIQQIGQAVNGYINIRYDKLSVLTNAAGTGIDPGPRTCTTANSICTITSQTLVNEGLLPSTYVAKNSFGSDYTIQLKRSGTSPNYIIDGVVVTNSAWVEGGSIRYDLIGRAMQAAGIDSGMSKSTTQVDGYNGSWNYTSSNFPAINKAGILGYRVGYNSAMYSVYLRRDGTLPMTGNLNMGANDINNAKNITASGTGSFGGNVTSGGTVTAAGEVIAHNGYGDQISMGGDAAGGDYEIRLGTGKQLSIYSPNALDYTTVLSVNRNLLVQQRMSTNGFDPNDLPTGWTGGIRTWDIFTGGTIAIKRNGGSSNNDWAFSASQGGDLMASNSITSKGVINATGSITTSSNIGAAGYLSGSYVYSSGNIDAGAGITSNTLVTNYVKVNGSLDASGNMHTGGNSQIDGNVTSSNQIIANGRLSTNEYLQLNGVAGEGNGCSPNGLVGRTAAGKLLSCTNGAWTAAAVGTPGYYCRLTTFDGGRSDDYVGYTPRTDRSCPVIYPGQAPNGTCSCIKVVLAY